MEEEGLQSQLDAIILDIIHVSEYVWASAAAIFGEKSKCRQSWVKDVLSDLLDSKVGKVIDDLLTIGEKTDLSDSKFEQLCTTVNYFINHEHKMDYKEYLEKGYPISSAMAESTCKHLVKDRMATSGTR